MAVFKGAVTPLNQDDASRRVDLCRLTVSHFDFNGNPQQGELVVHNEVADELVTLFETLFRHRFPIDKMRRIDEYARCDHCSMVDNNSYAYCHRVIDGTDRLSWHGFGLAIDINPRQNPIITDAAALPPGSAAYTDRRRPQPGMIIENDLVHSAFAEAGWDWGGLWNDFQDYHHFQKPLPSLESLRYGHRQQNNACRKCDETTRL